MGADCDNQLGTAGDGVYSVPSGPCCVSQVVQAEPGSTENDGKGHFSCRSELSSAFGGVTVDRGLDIDSELGNVLERKGWPAFLFLWHLPESNSRAL